MLTHVVMFRFEDLAAAALVRDELLAMKGRIPTLLDIECGVDITRSGRSYDLALITRHADQAGLEAYAAHPVHQAVLEVVRPRAQSAVAVDFISAKPHP